MWDSNAPLQLLQNMPKKLTKENLDKLQLVIDADKYKNSLVSGFDLCGMYAPFCRGCKKTSIYPCAIAYINMMRSNGMDIEIDAKPVAPVQVEVPIVEPIVQPVEEEVIEEVPVTVSEQPIEIEKAVEEELPVQQEQTEVTVVEETPEEVPAPVSEKRKIRIAMARRKF